MKISQALFKLKVILDKYGDIDLKVDTEGGDFPCHLVDAQEIYRIGEEEGIEVPFCMLKLDSAVMAKVHPEKSLEGSVIHSCAECNNPCTLVQHFMKMDHPEGGLKPKVCPFDGAGDCNWKEPLNKI